MVFSRDRRLACALTATEGSHGFWPRDCRGTLSQDVVRRLEGKLEAAERALSVNPAL